MYTYVDFYRLDVYDRLHEQIDSFRFPSDGACFGMQAIEPERGTELYLAKSRGVHASVASRFASSVSLSGHVAGHERLPVVEVTLCWMAFHWINCALSSRPRTKAASRRPAAA